MDELAELLDGKLNDGRVLLLLGFRDGGPWVRATGIQADRVSQVDGVPAWVVLLSQADAGSPDVSPPSALGWMSRWVSALPSPRPVARR